MESSHSAFGGNRRCKLSELLQGYIVSFIFLLSKLSVLVWDRIMEKMESSQFFFLSSSSSSFLHSFLHFPPPSSLILS